MSNSGQNFSWNNNDKIYYGKCYNGMPPLLITSKQMGDFNVKNVIPV